MLDGRRADEMIEIKWTLICDGCGANQVVPYIHDEDRSPSGRPDPDQVAERMGWTTEYPEVRGTLVKEMAFCPNCSRGRVA